MTSDSFWVSRALTLAARLELSRARGRSDIIIARRSVPGDWSWVFLLMGWRPRIVDRPGVVGGLIVALATVCAVLSADFNAPPRFDGAGYAVLAGHSRRAKATERSTAPIRLATPTSLPDIPRLGRALAHKQAGRCWRHTPCL